MTEQTQPNGEAKETVEATAVPNTGEQRTLSKEDQLNAIRQVFQFLSDYDRVPGSLSSTWSQLLDALALVHNSIASELETKEAKTTKKK